MTTKRRDRDLRKVVGLKWAIRAQSPWPKTKAPTGTKAQGLGFERAVARELPSAEHNPWFKFEDKRGVGFCSPDLLLVTRSGAAILECKLTAWGEAWEQLTHLYLPVVRLALGVEPRLVCVVKYAAQDAQLVPTLREALNCTGRPVVHWIGKGPFPLR